MEPVAFGDWDPEDAWSTEDEPGYRVEVLSLVVPSITAECAEVDCDQARVRSRIRWANRVVGEMRDRGEGNQRTLRRLHRRLRKLAEAQGA